MHRGQVTCNLAGEWVWSPRWVALLEFYSSWEVGPLIGRRTGPPAALLGVLPGLEFILSPRWNLEAGVAIDLAGKNSTYNLHAHRYCDLHFLRRLIPICGEERRRPQAALW